MVLVLSLRDEVSLTAVLGVQFLTLLVSAVVLQSMVLDQVPVLAAVIPVSAMG